MEKERDASLRGWELIDYGGEDIYFQDCDVDGFVIPEEAYKRDIIILRATDIDEKVHKVIIKDSLLKELVAERF